MTCGCPSLGRLVCIAQEQWPDLTGTVGTTPVTCTKRPLGGLPRERQQSSLGPTPRLPESRTLTGAQTSGRPRAPGTLTLTTGGVGGTTGMMGVAGGGGAAAGGTGTDAMFAVIVGTGVAAMTGVWETAGGTF